MCSPTAAIITSLAIGAAGTYTSAIAAQNKQEADNRALEYNASVAENNAVVQDMKAADASARGDIAAKQQRLRVSQTEGAQRAGFAGSGVTVDTGSALATIEDTAGFGEYDAMTIEHNAAVEAWGSNVQGSNLRASAGLTRSQKGDPKAARNTTLLTGATRLGQQYLGYKYGGF